MDGWSLEPETIRRRRTSWLYRQPHGDPVALNAENPTSTRYRIARPLGQGGMAEVYEAIALGDSGFERRVALKKILPEIAHEASVRRMFLEEARLASQFHHGNIVQVIDFGAADGAEFLVMEYVDGLSLSEAVRRGQQQGHPIPVGVALHLMAEVAHALAYLHEFRGPEGDLRSAVHRDISPNNVLLSWGGDVKVVDFGIATMPAPGERFTQNGVAKGKREYMAPEQARGEVVTGAADVWSAGAVLRAVLTERCGGEPLDVSRDVSDLIKQCTKPESAERCSAVELAQRAGALAASCLKGGGRNALVQWLDGLRTVEPAARQSAKGDLFGWMIVPTQNARRFTVEEERPRAAVTAPPRGPEPIAPRSPIRSTPVPKNPPVRRAPPHGALAWTLSVAGVITGALGLGLFLTRPRSAGEMPTVDVAKTAVSAASEAGGWVRIGGPEVFGSSVSIDGDPAGHAPMEVELSAGRHTVSVVGEARSIVRTVYIGPKHTRRSALRIRP